MMSLEERVAALEIAVQELQQERRRTYSMEIKTDPKAVLQAIHGISGDTEEKR
jgi:hypothetical protein